MDDGPNRGQPSDRVEVGLGSRVGDRWPPRRTLGIEPSAGAGISGPMSPARRTVGAAVLLSAGTGRSVPSPPGDPDRGPCTDRHPADIERAPPTEPRLALAWRHELRAALALLMADKCWQVTGFARDGWYLLERTPPGLMCEGADR